MIDTRANKTISKIRYKKVKNKKKHQKIDNLFNFRKKNELGIKSKKDITGERTYKREQQKSIKTRIS